MQSLCAGFPQIPLPGDPAHLSPRLAVFPARLHIAGKSAQSIVPTRGALRQPSTCLLEGCGRNPVAMLSPQPRPLNETSLLERLDVSSDGLPGHRQNSCELADGDLTAGSYSFEDLNSDRIR